VSADGATLGDIVAAFGDRSFLPMLMVPALLVFSPLSGIPFFSTLCGLTIILISAQMLWPGREVLWLPGRLTRQRISGAKARAAVRGLLGTARWIDARTRRRYGFLLRREGRTVLEAACLVAGLAMPVFEVMPFTSSLLGLAVLLLATAMLTRDGLFALLGLAMLMAGPVLPAVALGALFGARGG
jgi:hypothetical protein